MTELRVYKGRNGLSRTIELVDTTIETLNEEQRSLPAPTTPQQMLSTETKRKALGTAIEDLFIARDIIKAHQDQDLRSRALAEGRQRYRDQGFSVSIRNKGWSSVTILLPGGLRLRMRSPYLLPSRKRKRGRPRGPGKRGKGGVGAYPILESLGITDGATPWTRSEVSRQAVLCSSYAEAQDQLSRGGLVLDVDTIARIAKRSGEKAMKLREEALKKALNSPLPPHSTLAGKRIRLSVDGGRARTRKTKRRARKQKNGRRPFDLEWREPRIITIDVLDQDGKTDLSWRPLYEVTIRPADDVFELMCGLLRLIGAHLAAELVFIADGAEWIWNRVESLMVKAEIPRERVHLVLDYYHATEHISEALKACKSLKPKQRTALIKRFSKELLKPDGPSKVIEKLRGFAKGRRGKKVSKEIAYLDGHLEHMRYWTLRSNRLPIGSGVVESTVRRVINLRFKSASMCWCEDALESLMYLRAILKSGWWDEHTSCQLAGQHFLDAECLRSSNDEENRGKAA